MASPFPTPAPGGDQMWRRLGLVLAVLIASIVAASAAYAVAEGNGAGEAGASVASVLVGGAVLAVLAVAPLLHDHPGHLRRMILAGRPPRPSGIVAGLGLGLVAAIVSGLVVSAGIAIDPGVEETLEDLQDLPAASAWQYAAFGVGTVILAPAAEEIIFRGVVLRALARRMDFGPAAVGSALLFAAVHVGAWVAWPVAVALPLVGLLLAWTYKRFGLAGSIAAHASNNALALVGTILS